MTVLVETPATSLIGRRTRRQDGPEKLTAATRYAGDLTLPGLLHARLVLSPHTHARVTSIDDSAAQGVPGFVRALLAADLPVQRVDDLRKSDPLARDRVLWAGQPVAIVVAETEAAAEDAANLIEVTYAAEEPLLDPIQAMSEGAQQVRERVDKGTSAEAAHATAGAGKQPTDDESLSGNVTNRVHHRRGDVDAGFAQADAVVELRCHTSAVHQSYLEPQTALASVDGIGNLTVWTSTQSVFYTRQELAALLGLPVRKVRIVAAPLGGGFGGKLLLVEPLVAAAALVLRRPVRLTFTRTEDFLAGNPGGAGNIRVKVGARRDGTLVALQGRVVMDAGAFPEWSTAGLVCLALGGFYRCPNLDIRGYDVMTNRPGPGSYRAPGAPQGAFAIESAMDDLARTLGLDPIEMRLTNAVREGDPQPDGSPWGRIGLVECLERLRAEPAEQLPRGDTKGSPPPSGGGRGVGLPYLAEGTGIAIGGWPGGLEPAAALCRLDQDGSLRIVIGSVDMTGSNTSLAIIAAEAFGTSVGQVTVVNEDSNSAPFAGISGGSKITYTVGRAVQLAAEDARRQVRLIAADLLEAGVDDIEVVAGRAQVVGAPDRGIGMAELAAEIFDFNGRFDPVEGRGASAITANAPGFVAHRARVTVDRETGAIALRSYVAVQDVGRAINPAAVEGQIHGGVAQGIGWGLYEALPYGPDGQPLAASFQDYAIPTAARVPAITSALVEVPAEAGPFGAKGVGEPPIVPGAAAISNAIRDAIGARLTDLPITPEQVYRALNA